MRKREKAEIKEGKNEVGLCAGDSALVTDLSRNFRVKYYPVEVSVRGQITKNNAARFKTF